MTTLHICHLEKFIPPFIDFVRTEFPDTNQRFFCYGDKSKYSYISGKDTFFASECIGGKISGVRNIGRLIFEMHISSKIILHGLFDLRIILILFLFPYLANKSYWMIWGGDLYELNQPRIRLRSKLRKALRKKVIKNIGYLVTYVRKDVEIAREQYGAKGKYVECINYLSNVCKVSKTPRSSLSVRNILVGNSADPSNEHLNIFKYLDRIEHKPDRIYVPLSYGDKLYAESVIEVGTRKFADKFYPLITFLSIDEYHQILSSVDVAIFNHDRQQAMGNIIYLLSLGKVVYIRPTTSSWSFFSEKKIKVRSITSLHETLSQPLTQCEAEYNFKVIRDYFNHANLKAQLATFLL